MIISSRVMPEVKLDQPMQVLQAAGNMALRDSEIAGIDLNPIMIRNDEPVVADALIVLG